MDAPAAKVWSQRCFNHVQRAAAARCPACKRYFCRECVTEHKGKVLCCACLAGRDRTTSRARLPSLTLAALAGVGLLAGWAFLYCIGSYLLRLGSEFYKVQP